MNVYTLLSYISKFLALLIVLPLHEFAHAFAAVKSGDPTPRIYRRYTINPLAHFDLIGLACFLFAGFGWAKPVPVNPNNFRKYKKGCFFVSVAGVCANYLLAFLAFPLIHLVILYVPTFGYFTYVLELTLFYVLNFSLAFFVFNLIPVYPLDGFRVVDVFNKKRGPIYRFLRHQGIYVLYALILLSFISEVTGIWQINIFGRAMQYIINLISRPILWFWGLIF